ncbi:hypothetical protein ACFQRC_06365 [Enterovirga sp. GCM10030262]|uniref:hypothetical protein n=1 Tax=Enterovirga sp. GCM10030262 TaxID=3273391 RepID=UPI00361FFA8D
MIRSASSLSLLAIFGAAALAATPALADKGEHAHANEAATEAEAPKAPAAKEEKKVCKTIETTGSRTGGKKVCMTRAEWKKVDM